MIGTSGVSSRAYDLRGQMASETYTVTGTSDRFSSAWGYYSTGLAGWRQRRAKRPRGAEVEKD